MKKQVQFFPYDVRAKAFLSTLYATAGDSANAVLTAKEGLAVSDRRQQFYFLLGEAYFKSGDENSAIAAMRAAYELAPEYPDAIHNYAVVLIFSGHTKAAEDLLKEHFGVEIYPDPKYVNAYAALGDFGKVTQVWEGLVARNPNDVQYRVSLASIYARIGERAKAIKELNKAIELWPSFKDQGELFIKQIESGQFGK